MKDANLTDAGVQAAQGKAFPASITLDPAGIEMFAMILHIVYAHKANPTQPKPDDSGDTFSANNDAACDYLRSSGKVALRARWTMQPFKGKDRTIFIYTIYHPDRGEDAITIAIDPCRVRDECLFVVRDKQFIQLDLAHIRLQDPL